MLEWIENKTYTHLHLAVSSDMNRGTWLFMLQKPHNQSLTISNLDEMHVHLNQKLLKMQPQVTPDHD